jgi:hypothetical protein
MRIILRRWTTVLAIIIALGVSVVAVPRLVSAATQTNATFSPAAPQRLLDTRDGTGGQFGKVQAGTAIAVHAPFGAQAVAVNITVTNPEGPGFITAWPGGPRPTVSSVNYSADQTVPNFAIVPVGADGNFQLFTLATTDIIVDLTGTFQEPRAGSVPANTGITATITNYSPSSSFTFISGTASNGTNETITIAIDLQAPTGQTTTTYANDVAPGAVAAWSTSFNGQFSSGAVVIRAIKAF